jgi:CspA family cold shock protein
LHCLVGKRANSVLKNPINGRQNCQTARRLNEETTRMSGRKQQDETLFCERCGISFLWSTEEQKEAEQQPSRADEPRLCPGCRQLLPAPGRERGLVKWYNTRKHYGFITRRSSGELYLHGSALREPGRLVPGDLVEFTVGANERGSIATDVLVLERGNAAKEDAAKRRG